LAKGSQADNAEAAEEWRRVALSVAHKTGKNIG
jgi:hypothetical protein